MKKGIRVCVVAVRQRSVRALLPILLYLALAPALSLDLHRGLYAISLCMKDLLLWTLPITACLLIAHTVSSFQKQALLFVLFLCLFEAMSNLLSVWYAFGCSHLIAGHLHAPVLHPVADDFTPLWHVSFAQPIWWSSSKGALVGVVLGLGATFPVPRLRAAIARGKELAEWILTRMFSPLIPLFILGIVARMYKTQLLGQMVAECADFFVWYILFLTLYLGLLFLGGSGFSLRKFCLSIKNLCPAAAIALTSGCSLSTMPWTIQGTAKNLDNPAWAQAVIPATTSIQQVGDCIANACLCFLMYLDAYGQPPPLAIWVPFTLVFVLARFAVAGVMGGAIFIMLPIYASYLNFTPEMLAVILAFNVILDPVITCANVLGNGALCRILERLWLLLRRKLVPSFAGEEIAKLAVKKDEKGVGM